MRQITLLLTLTILFCSSIYGQKRYEMVIEKTDGTETVIPTNEIVRTYFREITSNPDNPTKDFDLIGTWCYGASEEDAFGDMNNIEGYIFRDNGTCTYFAIYNQGKNKEIRHGTYTYQNGILNVVTNKSRTYNVTISGNCMTWTGDDDETLYTREGLTVDLGEDSSQYTPSNIDLVQLFGKWVCYYQQWTQYGETNSSNYITDEYILELNSDYTGKIFAGKDELFEWGAGKNGDTFSWTLSESKIIITYINSNGSFVHALKIVSITDEELIMQWEDKDADYVIMGKFKKNSIEGGSGSDVSYDPEGTTYVECKRNTWLDLFEEAKSAIYCDKNIFETHNVYVDMMDVGEVNGIGEISIPAVTWSAWQKTATQRVGHGYIFRYTGSSTNIIKYAVVYIVNLMATSPMSYMIKYITPFELPNTDIIPTGFYVEENYDKTNYFTFYANGSYISWKHYINDKEEQNSTVGSEIKTDIDYIYLAHGDKFILSSSIGSSILSYKRDGNCVSIGDKSYIKLQQIIENHH